MLSTEVLHLVTPIMTQWWITLLYLLIPSEECGFQMLSLGTRDLRSGLLTNEAREAEAEVLHDGVQRAGATFSLSDTPTCHTAAHFITFLMN